MRIADISPDNRPRERFQKLGAHALSDAELLAIILQKGTRGENVIDMSNRLLSKFGIDKLSGLSLKELQEIDGIGPAKSIQIKTVFELAKRHNLAKKSGGQVKSAKDVFEYASQRLVAEDKEQFMILYLDTKNRIIRDEIVSVGTLNSSLVHPREIFKGAIKESANAIILVHNHPSGDPTPSDEDKVVTKRLSEAGEILSINMLDHVIVGADEFYSFEENK